MPSTSDPIVVTHNENLRRFEAQIGGQLAFLSYIRNGGHAIFDHSFVPNELRGRGMASALARAALDEARLQHWKVVPLCSFVADFIERNPEFSDLVAKSTK